MEKNPSASLYKQNWYFKCFSCGASMSFSRLYKELKNEAWNEHGVLNLTDVDKFSSYETDFEKERAAFEITDGHVTSVYDNAKALNYCRSRFISDAFIQEFGLKATDLCRFKNKKIWTDRLLIPIDFLSKPYSIEGRDYLRTQTPKCLYPKDANVDICFNQDNLRKNETLVVCEGLMDIPKIWDFFTKNVTATFGVSLTDKQKEFLKDARDLILFIDDDEAGRSSVGFFESFMERDFRVAVVAGKDPGDSTPEEIEQALKNSKKYGDFIIEESGLFHREAFSLA